MPAVPPIVAMFDEKEGGERSSRLPWLLWDNGMLVVATPRVDFDVAGLPCLATNVGLEVAESTFVFFVTRLEGDDRLADQLSLLGSASAAAPCHS
jgi:hypothetical protein